MKLIKLKTQDQFEELKKGDILLIEWSDFFVKHSQYGGECDKLMKYKVVENKKPYDEIILRTKGNHYMNWKMYLGLDTIGVNTSQALQVYRLEV